MSGKPETNTSSLREKGSIEVTDEETMDQEVAEEACEKNSDLRHKLNTPKTSPRQMCMCFQQCTVPSSLLLWHASQMNIGVGESDCA